MKFNGLSIVIPTKDRKEVFEATLSAAHSAIQNLNAEIIIINDSKTQTIEIPESYRDKVRVFSNSKNGVASARNLGAERSSYELLLFLDDDIHITRKNISETLSFFDSHDDRKSCLNLNWKYPTELADKLKDTSFGRYLLHYGFTSLEGRGWLNQTFSDRESFQVIPGAASFYLSLTKTVFKETGGYSDSFSYAGFEDHDFAMRLKNHGINCFILPSSFVFHNEVDRLELKQWMNRKVRNGVTRRQAVEAGYKNLELNNNFLKHFSYAVLVKCKPILFMFEKTIPNLPIFDLIYFRLTNLLLGVSIFEGYHKEKQKGA